MKLAQQNDNVVVTLDTEEGQIIFGALADVAANAAALGEVDLSTMIIQYVVQYFAFAAFGTTLKNPPDFDKICAAVLNIASNIYLGGISNADS